MLADIATNAKRGSEAAPMSLMTTEICVTFPVLQMLDEGYEVQVSADASASYTKYGDDIALRRMEKAGAVITTVDQIISELAVDWTSPLGQKLVGILNYH
ncbi:isochorismatase family protein [Rhizobium sp. 3T7]|uniref:isochorismatase family protein n=1 Tax=Rhizobium sp. 3T7 TaxID=2874922 RepID=UPI001CC988E4|nr:isochorismatase family protein [Rhizobium sp. 3T7]MBZ9792097.1 isochorismatase family protein [Rhizobium sp. 3T7]